MGRTAGTDGLDPVKSRLNHLARQISAPWLRWTLGLGLGGLLLWLAAKEVNLGDVGTVLAQADPGWVSAALVSVLLSLVLRSLRWQILLAPGRPHTPPLPHSLLLPSLFVGQLLNALAPTRLGDLSRAYVVGREGLSRSFVLGTVVVEKLFDAVAYGLLLLLLLALTPLPDWAKPAAISFVAITGALFVVLALAGLSRGRLLDWLTVVRLPWLPQLLVQGVARRLEAGLVSLDVLQSRATVAQLLAWSLLIWITGALTNYLLFPALGLDLPPAAALLLLVVLQISVTLPPSPGNMGIFEGICIFTLAIFGVDRTTGLSYGLLLHAVVFLPTVIGGLISLGRLGLWGQKFDAAPRLPESIETMIASEAVLAREWNTSEEDEAWKDL